MDYVILKTGNKQYRVKPGDVIEVEKLPVEEGSAIELTDVLAFSRDGEMIFGDPLVPNASVVAQVKAQDRDKKIIVFKFKRKVRYQRKKGHRQPYTRLAITGIVLNGVEIGIPEKPAPEIMAEEEPLVEEVLVELPAELDDSVKDEPTGELVSGPEDIVAEPDDEHASEPGDSSTDEPSGELEDEAQDETVDEDRRGGEANGP